MRSKLLNYFKLMTGGFTGSKEIDFADINEKQLKVVKHQWKYDFDFLVCPVPMFTGSDPKTCYREGIIEVVLAQYIDDKGNYVYTPEFSHFRNDFIKINFESLYKFEWNYRRLYTGGDLNNQRNFPSYLNSQKNKMRLVFSKS